MFRWLVEEVGGAIARRSRAESGRNRVKSHSDPEATNRPVARPNAGYGPALQAPGRADADHLAQEQPEVWKPASYRTDRVPAASRRRRPRPAGVPPARCCPESAAAGGSFGCRLTSRTRPLLPARRPSHGSRNAVSPRTSQVARHRYNGEGKGGLRRKWSIQQHDGIEGRVRPACPGPASGRRSRPSGTGWG